MTAVRKELYVQNGCYVSVFYMPNVSLKCVEKCSFVLIGSFTSLVFLLLQRMRWCRKLNNKATTRSIFTTKDTLRIHLHTQDAREALVETDTPTKLGKFNECDL